MSRHPQFDAFLERVLADPIARSAFERAQKQPTPLRVDGAEYRRRRNRR